MDIEYLADRNRKSVMDARQVIKKHNGFDTITSEGAVKKIYASIHDNRGFADLLSKSEPTYYRKDTALARNYIWYDYNPTIVFMPYWKSSETGFKEYTGLDIDSFFTQVQNGSLIPVFGKAENYDNDLFQELLNQWQKQLSDKDPLFANPIEKALMLEDELTQTQLDNLSKHTITNHEYWEGEAKYLKQEYPILNEFEGKRIAYTSELDRAEPVQYLAERMFMLRTAGFDGVVSVLHEFLNQLGDGQNYSDAENSLRDIMKLAFVAHMTCTNPIYYSMGGGGTRSIEDQQKCLQTFHKLQQRVEEQEPSFDPDRYHLEDSTYIPSDSLSIQIPGPQSQSGRILNDENLRDEIKKYTNQKTELQRSIAQWKNGGLDISEVKAKAIETREANKSFTGEVGRVDYDELTSVTVDVGGAVLSDSDSDSAEDIFSAFSSYLESLGTLFESDETDSTTPYRTDSKPSDQDPDMNSVSSSTVDNLDIWQTDYTE